MPECQIDPPSALGLRFPCGACQHELEAPLACAEREGTCPRCGHLVRAPQAPREAPVPPPRRHPVGRSREEGEIEGAAKDRQERRRLRALTLALGLLLVGILGVGGAALIYPQTRPGAASPELSPRVLDRMQQSDRQREAAVQSARSTLEALLGAAQAEAAADLLMPGSAAGPGMSFPCFPGVEPDDFELIQARRIPGAGRFLTLFEIAANPPLVVPVEQTAAGSRVHGLALAQQRGGLLGKFLGSPGAGEGVFYVLLRPASPAQAAQLPQSGVDWQDFQAVALEPAFPADGAAPCVVCLAPNSPAREVFAARSEDPSLRPAVVRLAWRQHRDGGNFVELLAFVPNAWSRH